jgi:SpoVK/Ycf46/Vps4 family AAA+-type ATPase
MNEAEPTSLDQLRHALERLDRLLDRAVAHAEEAYGPDAQLDPYRGLHIPVEEVERLLRQKPLESVLREDDVAGTEPSRVGARPPSTAARVSRSWWPWSRPTPAPPSIPLELPKEPVPALPPGEDPLEELLPDWLLRGTALWTLAQEYQLSKFEREVILIALAPEIDLRYERLFAFLQDDVTRKRPAIDLVLDLLCQTAEEKLAARAYFGTEASLVRHKLIHLVADPHQVKPSLLAHYVQLDEQIVDCLLGQSGLDRRLAGFCRLIEPSISLEDLSLDGEFQAFSQLIQEARQLRHPLRLYFQGPRGSGKRLAAEAMAGQAGIKLLIVDLEVALSAEKDFEQLLDITLREARFQDALLYLDGLDVFRTSDGVSQYQRILDKMNQFPEVAILSGSLAWEPPNDGPLGVLALHFSFPTFEERQALWERRLAEMGVVLNASELQTIASRFRLTPVQIANAVATAWNESLLHQGEPGLKLKGLLAAARAQSGYDLTKLARKITPLYTWDDIILPDDIMAQLHEISQRVAHRELVMETWGFERKLSQGKGTAALFAGPAGTGKTMAAEILANDLGLDLYKIDLSSVVSKYIGETEKNLEKIFNAAENANAILFFDEAEALFGKRSEVRDAHDRYANIEIAYLLQKMEQYEGLAILATNLRQNMDEAFIRRLQFIIEVPFPDEASRLRIWQSLFPSQAPRDESIHFGFLAGQRLSGGEIKNIVLHAAFLAAAQGDRIGMSHLLRATQREFQKKGKVLSEAELGRYRELVLAS